VTGVRKAVIPVAGLGTRFLPATKAMPKEMLPVVDKPAIQYVVEEAVAAGLRDVLMVTGRNKNAVENHFDRAVELEELLEAKGQHDRLAAVSRSTALADVHYVRQGDPRGLGHAVLRARSYIGDEPFAVLLGDDLIDPRHPLLERMLEAQAAFGGSVVALMAVDPADVHRYGVATLDGAPDGDVARLTDLVEKPEPGTAPSNLVVIGRYVLAPEVFPVLERLGPGRGGEIQLTDALQELARSGAGVRGVVFDGLRYDTGDRLEYLKAVVRIAADRGDLGPEFRRWLRDFVAAAGDERRPARLSA
jgi:UTP--glucose-1-phosphate uridylyltransferase